MMSIFSKAKITVSIIGTAGRREDGSKLTSEIFNRAIDKTKKVIKDNFKLSLEEVHLVSGGAAWMDHIAVSLFLQGEVPHLSLHLPCKFENSSETPQFIDNGEKNWTNNPGRTANIYHKKFSAKINDNSLKQIQSAILIGANCKEYNGFHERNSRVAESRYLIAFTWGDADVPKKGGTRDTWDKCVGRKIHIPLGTLITRAQLPLNIETKKTTGHKNPETASLIHTLGCKSTKVLAKASKAIKKTSPKKPSLKKHCSSLVINQCNTVAVSKQARISRERNGEEILGHSCDTELIQLGGTDLSKRKRTFPDSADIEKSPPSKKINSTSAVMINCCAEPSS